MGLFSKPRRDSHLPIKLDNTIIIDPMKLSVHNVMGGFELVGIDAADCIQSLVDLSFENETRDNDRDDVLRVYYSNDRFVQILYNRLTRSVEEAIYYTLLDTLDIDPSEFLECLEGNDTYNYNDFTFRSTLPLSHARLCGISHLTNQFMGWDGEAFYKEYVRPLENGTMEYVIAECLSMNTKDGMDVSKVTSNIYVGMDVTNSLTIL